MIDKTMCRIEEPCHRSKVKVTAGTLNCAFQNRVRPIFSFENWWDLKIIWQNDHQVCKNHVARSEVKVTVHTYSLCRGILCSAHNFILHGGI